MELSDFKIGGEFNFAGKRWRCTDIGTRVVAAICLEPVTVGYVTSNSDSVKRRDNDPSWFNGPPYAVSETVFDEYDQPACTVVK
jgi:hypothetical protein